MTYRELEKVLKTKGWYMIGQNGSHTKWKHDSYTNKLTVPKSKKDIAKGTLHSILKDAGLK